MSGASGTSMRAWSMAAPSTSARSTIPAPPPAGVSSTWRWRPSPKSRICTLASDHNPADSAEPTSDTPSGPGNISGNNVSTVARQGERPSLVGKCAITPSVSAENQAISAEYDFKHEDVQHHRQSQQPYRNDRSRRRTADRPRRIRHDRGAMLGQHLGRNQPDRQPNPRRHDQKIIQIAEH